jgi:hypothetical protein
MGLDMADEALEVLEALRGVAPREPSVCFQMGRLYKQVGPGWKVEGGRLRGMGRCWCWCWCARVACTSRWGGETRWGPAGLELL